MYVVYKVGYLFGRLGDPFGEAPDLVGDNGESPALFARPCGFDGGVQREKVSLGRDVVDNRDDLAYLDRLLAKVGYPSGGCVDGRFYSADAFDRLRHHIGAGA